MDLLQSLEHLDRSKSEVDDGSSVSQLEISRDVQRLTYTYYSGEDESVSHGPHCRDCMNQLFRDGKLNAISMVFVFTTLGYIPFPIRTLVFLNGMDDTFSVKDITEDFLVMKCCSCCNVNKLNTIPATNADEVRIICTSSGRKRKLSNRSSKEKLPQVRVKEELDVSPILLGKLQERNADQPAIQISPIINKHIFSVPTSPVVSTARASEKISAGKENSVIEANSTNARSHCKLLVDGTPTVVGSELTIVDQSASVTGRSTGGISGDLTSRTDELPTDMFTKNDSNSLRNVNKVSNRVCATKADGMEDDSFCEIIEISSANSRARAGNPKRLLDRAYTPTSSEPSNPAALNDKQKRNTPEVYHREKEADIARRNTGLGRNSGSFSNTFQCSSDISSIPPPPISLRHSTISSPVCSAGSSQNSAHEDYVPRMSISSRLQAEWDLRKKRPSEAESQQLVKMATNQPPADKQGSCLSDNVTEILKSLYGADKLLKYSLADVLDSRIVEEARESMKSKGFYNPYVMIPFFAGTSKDVPGISFEEIYDGMQFLRGCGMVKHTLAFGKFMCEFLPEIADIHRCDHCGIVLPPDASGAVYISHFLSFGHIIQAMNRGCVFSCDFNSLRKCLQDFLIRNGHLDYSKILRGPKLAACIELRQFSSADKEFKLWLDFLKK